MGVLLFAGCLEPLVVLALESKTDALCGGIDSVNKGEQRMCMPPKTQDVKISSYWEDLTAYRYDIKNLPETEVRTSYFEENEWIYKYSYTYFNFGLLPGGFMNFTYQTAYENMMDIYLMTPAQYRDFKNEKPFDFEWGSKNTSHASHVFTAKEAGVYYIVVDAKHKSVKVLKKVDITTPAYKMSNSTAKEACGYSCTFKKVHNDEVVIIEYLGKRADVQVKVFSGKGSFQNSFIFPITLITIFMVLTGAGSAVIIYHHVTKVQKSCKTKAATTEAQDTTTLQNENTPETETPTMATPEAMIGDTLYLDPSAPLISSAINDNVPFDYGTEPPPEFI